MKKLYMSLLASLIAFATVLSAQATELKIVNMAVRESSGGPDGNAVKNFLADNYMDFGVFDGAKGTSYFINTDFVKGGIDYGVTIGSLGVSKNNRYFFCIYDKAKYVVLYTKFETDSTVTGYGYAAGVFQDVKTGEQYAIYSFRKPFTSVENVGSVVAERVSALRELYPDARLFVCYNARLAGDAVGYFNTYVTDAEPGLAMNCMGCGTTGGFYASAAQLPTSYAISDWTIPNATYVGTLATVTVPTKHRVIFQDYDETGLQTNVVAHGGSVTPPTPPTRPGFEFTGWDHTAEEFANVTQSFTATAQYQVAGNSHIVSYYNWDGELIEAAAVEDGELCDPPDAPVRLDYTFSCWTTNGAPFDLSTPVKEDLELTAAYLLHPVQETATAEDFLRRIQAAYPTGTVIRLTADIDLEKADISTTNFYGVLDGNGFTITGIANEGRLFKNLYGTVRNCTFADLGDGVWEARASRSVIARNTYGAMIENCVFTNCQMCGNIAGGGAGLVALETFANGAVKTLISNCDAVNCRVVSKNTYSATVFGGFVKSAKGTDFINCRFLVDDRETKAIGGTGHANGGIAGESLGNCRFFGCHNEGKVVSSVAGDNYKGAGGICGGANGLTECYNCTNIADVIGCKGEGSAGIVARGCKCTVIISGCVNSGNVTTQYGDSNTNPFGCGAGGLIAGNWGSFSTIKIIDSVNYGNISTTTNDCDAGGLVGSFDNQGSVLYITNAFNYGNVISEQYAGGIVGQLYKHWISVNNVGNSGNVTSTSKRAGGFAGHIGNGANHSGYDLYGFLNSGEIVGSQSAALVAGGYEEIDDLIDNHIRVYDSVLAGSVSSVTGTVGVLSGALVGSHTCTMQGYADGNTILLQQGLVDYYNSEGPQSLATPIKAMTAADLMNGKAKKVLNGNATVYGVAPWIRGRNFPELSLFAKAVNGLQLIVR